MNKYRSTINPLTIIINVILYGVLLYLAYIRTPNLFVVILFIVIILIGYTSFKFVSYKYYLEDYGLLIKHKREKIIKNYKDIKYVEVNSETSGIIYGYGVNKLLISVGKGAIDSYIITPVNEKEFINNIELRVKNAKKGTN